MNKAYAMIALCLATAALPAAGQVISEDFKLLPRHGAAGDVFGWSVAVSGTTAVVGAAEDDGNGASSGSAYLFDTITGRQLFNLLPGDGETADQFGISVAISGTTAVVGAIWDDDNGASSGSAYLFDTTTGRQLFKLLPGDGEAGDQFGASVAICGTRAVVGARADDDNGDRSGSAYLFDTTSGQQLFKLLSADGEAGDQFGESVAISGTTAVVGAFFDYDNGSGSGSAYVFDTTTGQQLFKLLPRDGEAGDRFGESVAISGTTAVVGAAGDDDNGDASGSVYVFDTITGQQLAKLLPSDGAEENFFGGSVAISGATAVVGAEADNDNGAFSGSAYVFDTITGQQLAKLLPSDGAPNDLVGWSVAISGTTAVVGAIWDDDNGNSSGSAYAFSMPAPCPGDIADDFGTPGADGMISFGDFLALLGLIGPCPGGTPGCDGDIADDFGSLNGGDGMVSFGDFLALLGLIGPCPS